MIIETHDLTKTYKKKVAVNSVNLSVNQGWIYGFLGPNGAGKSTCIKMLTGLVLPTSGEGTVLGHPLGNVAARRKMGYLPELFRFQDWMTGEDLLDFHTGLYGLGRDKVRNKRVLSRVGLLGQERFKVGSYSKGMQQRIGFACALLPEPELLFLDEPTSALDPVGRKDVRDIITSLKKEGTTIFLNSHLLSEVEAVSDHIAIIHKGNVVKSGALSELSSQTIQLSVVCSPLPEDLCATLASRFNQGWSPQAESGGFTLTLTDGDEVPEIASLLVGNGVKLYEMTPRRETLESVFLKTIEESRGQ